MKKRGLVLVLFLSFFGSAQEDFTLKIERKPQYYAIFIPMRLKINGEKYKLKRKGSIELKVKQTDQIEIRSNYLFNKQVILNSAFSMDTVVRLTYKILSLTLRPILTESYPSSNGKPS